MAPIHELPLELLERVLDFTIDSPADLAARLVCRGFRDSSWKAWAACIDTHTAFDMRSYQSMMSLKAVGEHGELAKRVTGISLASFHVADAIPGPLRDLSYFSTHRESSQSTSEMAEDEYLSPAAFQHLNTIQQENSIWDATDAGSYVRDKIYDPYSSRNSDLVTKFLAARLCMFPNLVRAALIIRPYKYVFAESGTRWLAK